MALPVLNPPSENKNLDRIRESLRSNQAANDPGFSRTSTSKSIPPRESQERTGKQPMMPLLRESADRLNQLMRKP
jgi:hypothetical protein